MPSGVYTRTKPVWNKDKIGLQKWSEETREKMKKRKNYWKGKHLSEKHKEKIRKRHIGKKLSEDHKKKIGLSLKGEKCHWWKGGIAYLPYSVDWTETLKKSIRERDHYICQICLECGYPVHHKDYDKKNCCPDNLITLCRKCHNKTNFKRDYWINYFNNKNL